MAKSNQIFQGINLTIIAVVLILVVGSLLAISYLYPQPPNKTLSVVGTAQMKVTPDQVVVYAQILTKSSSSADEAKDLNAEIAAKVRDALLKANIARENIETSDFHVYPEYSWSPEGHTLRGYTASNSMKITVRDFEDVGKVIDAVVENGGLINSINYELSMNKMNEYKAQILAEAAKDARAKAEAIAAGLGRSLGRIVSVSGSDYNYHPYPIYRSDWIEYSLKDVSTNLHPAKLEITAVVSVIYEVN